MQPQDVEFHYEAGLLEHPLVTMYELSEIVVIVPVVLLHLVSGQRR